MADRKHQNRSHICLLMGQMERSKTSQYSYLSWPENTASQGSHFITSIHSSHSVDRVYVLPHIFRLRDVIPLTKITPNRFTVRQIEPGGGGSLQALHVKSFLYLFTVLETVAIHWVYTRYVR